MKIINASAVTHDIEQFILLPLYTCSDQKVYETFFASNES